MKSYYPEESLSNLNLKNKTIFLDTNTFIVLHSYQELFKSIIGNLRKLSCTFLTIPSVTFEFSRTDTFMGFDSRKTFLKDFVDVYPIEDYIEEFTEFTIVLQKINGRMSYTDFLLYCCLYKFPEAYLLTENHKDFLTSILNREKIITIDTEKEVIRNLAFYAFSSVKYEKAAANIIKEYV